MLKDFSDFKSNEKKAALEKAASDKDVNFIGKIAKFPKDAQASKAYSFLENVKINKNKTWYILIEKQNNELQMIKYNVKAGVNLEKFFQDLKNYYLSTFTNQPKLSQIIENLKISGEDKFVTISNIPNVEIAGTKLISRLTEDLVTLLGK